MLNPSLLYHPSLEGSASVGEPIRPSLFNTKDAFIERIAPVASAAIYFGSFSLAPNDISLSRQALFKLSFLHRHFLQPGGLRVAVEKQTAIFSGALASRSLYTMAEILARQIEGIRHIKDETTGPEDSTPEIQKRDSIQFLFATDQTLRSGVQVGFDKGRLTLEGEVSSPAQKSWAEQLAKAVGGEVDSRLKLSTFTPPPLMPSAEPPHLDDESLQALVHFRLRLVRETEHLPVKLKASRGVIALQGKVRTEALRQRVENLVRSTLGTRELRSSLSIAA